jgi:hypothetical protein
LLPTLLPTSTPTSSPSIAGLFLIRLYTV